MMALMIRFESQDGAKKVISLKRYRKNLQRIRINLKHLDAGKVQEAEKLIHEMEKNMKPTFPLIAEYGFRKLYNISSNIDFIRKEIHGSAADEIGRAKLLSKLEEIKPMWDEFQTVFSFRSMYLYVL